jgi:hypothetical protein
MSKEVWDVNATGTKTGYSQHLGTFDTEEEAAHIAKIWEGQVADLSIAMDEPVQLELRRVVGRPYVKAEGLF